MARALFVSALLLVQTGCFRGVTARADRFESYAVTALGQLDVANASIAQTNQQMNKMAQSLERMEGFMERMERFMKKFGPAEEETTRESQTTPIMTNVEFRPAKAMTSTESRMTKE
jgi:hypothetical protein